MTLNQAHAADYVGIPPEAMAAHEARLRAIGRAEGKRMTPFRGIVRRQRANREVWTATIRDPRLGSRGRAYLGNFEKPMQAAVAYDLALIVLGFPPVNYEESEYRREALREKFLAGLAGARRSLRDAGWNEPDDAQQGAMPTHRRH